MINFANITSLDGDNLAGINAFVFIPIEYVVSVPKQTNFGLAGSVVIDSGYDWFEVGFTLETCGFKEPQKEAKAGDFYEPELIFFVAKNSLNRIALFDKMAKHKYLVLCQDNNGLQRLLGSKTSPLQFKSSGEINDKVSGKNGYQCSFFGQSKHRAFVYLDGFDFNNDFNNDFNAL